FGHQFATKAAWPGALPAYARDFYIAQLKRSSDALRASFEFYRGLDKSIAQNRRRSETALTLPILAYSGALALGDCIAAGLKSIRTNVQSCIVDGSGHYPAEEKPDALLQAFRAFFHPMPQRPLTDGMASDAAAQDRIAPAAAGSADRN